jgi:peptide subunit release factor 1 (eRF1)
VRGLDDTLLALQEWRVWQLIYADGFASRGAQCTNCGALLAQETNSCGYCGEAVRVVDDLIELAAARVMEMQGKVELVRGPAAMRLKEAGGVGALLRF